jgi:hypothetical protein
VRYDHKRIPVFMYSTRYCCQILMKIEFSRHIFDKILTCQISWKSVQWEPSCVIRTDRRTCRTLTVAFRNFANAPKKPNH